MSQSQKKPVATYAFIDGQNLTKGTTLDKKPWRINLISFRKYLLEKYGVTVAYYYIGVYDGQFEKLYDFIRKAGYKLVFREHDVKAMAKKKGNVDTDIVFDIMNGVFVKQKPEKIVLVTGDGDYKRLVDLLIKKNKFKKIMFPNNKWSSLYKTIDDRFFAKIYTPDMRKILELTPKKSEKSAPFGVSSRRDLYSKYSKSNAKSQAERGKK